MAKRAMEKMKGSENTDSSEEIKLRDDNARQGLSSYYLGYTRNRMACAFLYATLLLAAAAKALVSPGSLDSDISIIIHNDLLGKKSLSNLSN
jgi:hypothetical protein